MFHSEADFQHALAWQFQIDHPDAIIRLETRPRRGVRLDLFVRLGDVRYGFELKYLVRRTDVVQDDELFDLPSQSAHDISRYDVCKDIVRCERLLHEGYVEHAFVIVLSNDGAYWRPGNKAAPIDVAFRLHEGRVLEGPLAWSPAAGAGTTRGRESTLELGGRYRCRWQDYSRVRDAQGRELMFRYLLLDAVGPRTESRQPPPVTTSMVANPSPDTPAPMITGLTAREEVLRAAQSFHSRGVVRFSPKELIQEARRQGAVSAT